MSSFTLKILAIITMTIDHIGFLLFPKIRILRQIGRLAFIIFAFQIGVGYSHTKSKEKYILRMIIFTIVSQLPFYVAMKEGSPNTAFTLNIGATLTCGLLAIYCFDKFKNKWMKYLSVVLIVFSIFILDYFQIIRMDYSWYGVLTVVLFYVFRNNKFYMSLSYFILLLIYCSYRNSVFNLPAVFALIPICLYNGKKGPNIKYLFYAFYPLHFLVLLYIKYKLNI